MQVRFPSRAIFFSLMMMTVERCAAAQASAKRVWSTKPEGAKRLRMQMGSTKLEGAMRPRMRAQSAKPEGAK